MEQDTEKESIIDTITDIGASAASSATGAAIGSAVAGPVGAVGGAVAGTLIEKVFKTLGKEIKERFLSKSEERKISTVYTIARDQIDEKLKQGKTLRDDNFFDEEDHDRSTAEEILEGTLFAAQRENEEKKIPYYARLYANIAFDNSISRPMANQLIKLAEQLTYRQLIILHEIAKFQLPLLVLTLKKTSYSAIAGLSNVTIASEIYEMYRNSLLSSKVIILDTPAINPSALSITGYGALLYKLMELHTLVPDKEASAIEGDIIIFLTDAKKAENSK